MRWLQPGELYLVKTRATASGPSELHSSATTALGANPQAFFYVLKSKNVQSFLLRKVSKKNKNEIIYSNAF